MYKPRTARSQRRTAFTLVELLVVIFIIGVLMAILLPAVAGIRGAARRTLSANNLHQIGLALHGYESAHTKFPPSWREPESPDGNNINGWSIHAQLLPYLEQGVITEKIDMRRSYSEYSSGGTLGTVVAADGEKTYLTAARVPVFVSPDEPRDESRLKNGVPNHYPVNYAANLGTFFVWDPATGKVGDGAFAPQRGFSAAAFARDGLSNTIAFAEVKAWQPYARNNGHDATQTNIAAILEAVKPDEDDGHLNNEAALSDIAALVTEADGAGNFKTESGHTEWVDGRAHQIGFTTVFRPNKKVLVDVKGDGQMVDVDWTNWQEGKNRAVDTEEESPTYAAVTARSYRAEGVLVLFMDDSTRLVREDINLGAWRAYSTRSGGEVISSEHQLGQ
jgi:prepilin-type N-terminal cleavage/methylation domain-containing protein